MPSRDPYNQGFYVKIIAVNVSGVVNTVKGFQAEDFPENITYDIESIDYTPTILRKEIVPTNVRPSPVGIAKILSAKVGDVGTGALFGNDLHWWVPEALLVKRCPTTP